MHHLAGSCHGAVFPWVLSSGMQALSQLLLQAWGVFLFISCLKQHGLYHSKTDSPHPQSSQVSAEQEQEVWGCLPSWKGSCSAFQLSGCPRFWGEQSAVPEQLQSLEHPGVLGARHSLSPEAPNFVLLHISWENSFYFSKLTTGLTWAKWAALVYQVCSLDIMMAIKTDAAFEQFPGCLCAWHCCRAAAGATLETPLQHFDIYFWAKQVVPTPISLLCQCLLWPQPVFIPNFCLWGEKLIRKFKAVRSYLKLIPLSATWRRNFCANYYWRTANSVATVN